MSEQQSILVSGRLRVKRGIYQMVILIKYPDGAKKEKSKSTGLQEKGNKKRAECMLRDFIQKTKETLAEQYERETTDAQELYLSLIHI